MATRNHLLSVLRARTPPGTNPAKDSSRGWVMAAHLGGMNVAGFPALVQSYEAWCGARLGGLMDFGGKDTWSLIEGSDSEWAAIKSNVSDKGQLVIRTLAMIPVGTDLTKPDSFTDLRTGAQGGYDQHWRNLADHIVNSGMGGRRIVFRLSWEWNGNNEFSPYQTYRAPVDVNNVMGGGTSKSYPNNPTLAADPTNIANRWAAVNDFVTYWRRIVDTVRGQLVARGANPWAVEWAGNPNLGYASSSQIVSWACYPGRKWMDYAGCDSYDTVVGGPYMVNGAVATGAAMTTARQQVWNAKRTGPYGFDWLAGFARREGLKLMIGETAISNQVSTTTNPTGGQDNPNWWPNVKQWCDDNADIMGIVTNYNITVSRENADFRVCEVNSSGAAGIDSTVSPLAAASYRNISWPSNWSGRVPAGASMPLPTSGPTPTGYGTSYGTSYGG